MLTALELEGFRGIGSRQRIALTPLTLIVGANSTGKSTILHALLYLHELLERGNADADRTELGGNVLELGGFSRLVHLHDLNRSIMLRIEYATPGSLERFGRALVGFPFPGLDDAVESAWLELTVRRRATSTSCGPLVDRAVIGVAGSLEPLVWIETGPTLGEDEPLYVRVNLGHPLVAKAGRPATDAWKRIAIPGVVLSDEPPPTNGEDRSLCIFAVSRSRFSALPPIDEPLRVIPFGDETEEKAAIAFQVRTFLEMLILGTTAQLAATLRDTLYIGPLRTIPPRGFLYERAGHLTSWADGLVAWDLLLADRSTLLAFMSGVVHGKDMIAVRIGLALAHALDASPDVEMGLYWDTFLASLDEAVRKELEMQLQQQWEPRSDWGKDLFAKGMAAGEAKGHADGIAKGELLGQVKGRASAVLSLLEHRGFTIPSDIRDQVMACLDLTSLDRWLRRVMTAQSVEEVLAP